MLKTTSTSEANILVGSSTDQQSVCLFHCGHSFHKPCLDIFQAKNDHSRRCPLCTSGDLTTKQSTTASNKSFLNKNPNTTVKNSRQNKNNIIKNSNEMSNGDPVEMIRQMNLEDSQIEINSKLSPISSVKQTKNNSENMAFNGSFNLQLSDAQIAALKSIRSRNQSSVKFMMSGSLNNSNMSYDDPSNGSMVQKRSQLQLAPANIVKYVWAFF